MAKPVPQEVQKLASLPTAVLGEFVEGFETVKGFLDRFGYFGYLGAEVRRSELLDEATSTALVRYQQMHGLPLTGLFDEATRDMMARARCGFPDIVPASEVAFSTACAWNRNALTYAFNAGTNDVAGDDERQAVRRAFATWSAAVQMSFRE